MGQAGAGVEGAPRQHCCRHYCGATPAGPGLAACLLRAGGCPPRRAHSPGTGRRRCARWGRPRPPPAPSARAASGPTAALPVSGESGGAGRRFDRRARVRTPGADARWGLGFVPSAADCGPHSTAADACRTRARAALHHGASSRVTSLTLLWGLGRRHIAARRCRPGYALAAKTCDLCDLSSIALLRDID